MPASEASIIGPHSDDLAARLAYWSACRGNDTAFLFLERGEIASSRLTFSDLHGRALAIAAVLRRRVLDEHPVLLLYPPGLEFIEAFCACLYSGAIAVPAPYPVTRQGAMRSAALCRASGATAVLTLASLLADADVRDRIGQQAPDLLWIATDAIGAADQAQDEPVDCSPDAVAFLQFTSGSSGAPKGVIVTRGNLAANQAMIAAAFGHDQTVRGVTWLPLFHDMGLVGTVLQALYLGSPSIIMSPFAFLQKPVRWLRAIAQYRATTSGAPNFAYELCSRKISNEQRVGLDLASWRVAFCGSEPVRAGTLRRFADIFGPFGFRDSALFPCYGLAEATLFACGGPAERGLKSLDVERRYLDIPGRIAHEGARERTITLASCGRSAAHQRIVIVDPVHGTPLDENEIGEIWLAGPHVCAGYWRMPKDTHEFFGARLASDEATRYLRTGDLGFLRDGELFVTGRLKDVIIVRGVKHHPEDIEATIAASHSALAGGLGAVFAIEDGVEAKVIALHEVEHKASAALDHEMLMGTAAAAVNACHGFLPDTIVLLRPGSLPRTTSGKVRRPLCRAAYLDGSFAERRSGRIGRTGP